MFITEIDLTSPSSNSYSSPPVLCAECADPALISNAGKEEIFEPENAKVKFGLVKNVNTFNPITITIMEWKKIFTDLNQSKRFKDSIKIT